MSAQPIARPALVRRVVGEVAYWTDVEQHRRGVCIAFSERGGGVSGGPFAGLNLAAHVGDYAQAVDANRAVLLDALGIGGLRERLTCAEQVHGDRVAGVTAHDAGSGAFTQDGRPPLPQTDALLTSEPDLPLMLFFADCVPVVLVAPGPCVAVAHAGWRGALAGIAEKTARELARAASCDPSQIDAYVGPHIGPCHYEVDERILSQFVNHFGTFARAESGGLDLGLVVAASLQTAGVDPCRIASLGICTAETTDRFYSYRAAAGPTGRHCAIVVVTPQQF